MKRMVIIVNEKTGSNTGETVELKQNIELDTECSVSMSEYNILYAATIEDVETGMKIQKYSIDVISMLDEPEATNGDDDSTCDKDATNEDAKDITSDIDLFFNIYNEIKTEIKDDLAAVEATKFIMIRI